MGNGIIRFIIDSVLDVIYGGDENCVICKNLCEEEQLICQACLDKVEFCSGSLIVKKDSYKFECFSAAYYTRVVMELIRRLKYKSDFKAGEVLAGFMIKLLNKNLLDFDLISYIPMTKAAKKHRGFNQSQFLASVIGRSYSKPVMKLLKKHKETRDQIGLDASCRWENLSDCFILNGNNEIHGKNILLIDDVVTTGATSYYCAKKLIENGAGKVIILTAAKSTL